MSTLRTGFMILGGLTAAAVAAGCGTNELGNIESTQKILTSEAVPKAAFDAELRAACGEGGITADGDQGFMRRPYLQKVTHDSAHVLWTTAEAVAPSVVVTTPDGEQIGEIAAQIDEQSQRAEFEQYDATLPQLEAGQIYCYSIVDDRGRTWLEPTGFRTAPPPGSNVPVRIAVIGDLGTQTTDQWLVRDQLAEVPYDLVLVVGDLAYENGTLSDHEKNFFEVYDGLTRSVPFFVISGNHDYAEAGAIFREVFALFENGGAEGRERWYSFDWGPIHFVALDTELIGPEQAAWLDADLAATDQPWRIAFMHRPAYSSGWHGSSAAVQEHFVPLFQKYGIEMAFAGHDHNYERTTDIDGTTYVVVGSSGRGTRAVGSSTFTAYSEAVSHFGYLHLDGEEAAFNAIDASGNDFDRVVIPR